METDVGELKYVCSSKKASRSTDHLAAALYLKRRVSEQALTVLHGNLLQ